MDNNHGSRRESDKDKIEGQYQHPSKTRPESAKAKGCDTYLHPNYSGDRRDYGYNFDSNLRFLSG
jgi:hypothetical protein